MSGNKGAVAIRFDYCDTNFCFITGHLAAGHSNVEERNTDYHTIMNGLHFLKGKNIDTHQSVPRSVTAFAPNYISADRNVIWLADTNYRIDLENERVRQLAQADDFDALLSADQVSNAMPPSRSNFIDIPSSYAE